MIDEVSVVIPAYNEEHYLPKLLQSIAIQHFPKKLQVIVVDGQSEDKTIEVANSFKKDFSDLEIIKAKRDTGHQRNIGADKAKYKYVMFLDADMVLPNNFFVKLFKKINPNENFLTMVFIWPASKNIIDYLLLGVAYPFMLLIYISKPTSPGGFTLTTKLNHKKIGGYKEGAILGEDTDYGHRAISAGAKPHLYFTPYVFHSVRRAKELGLVGLLLLWLKSYIYVRKNGVVYDNKKFHYPYGHYKGDK